MAAPTLRRWFELTGVVPLGVFVLMHVVTYGRSLFGATSFGVPAERSTLFVVADVLLVWLPLGFHGIYGIFLCFAPLEPAVSERRRGVLLRVSGALALAFIVVHAIYLDGPLIRGERGGPDVNQLVASELSATRAGIPWLALIHVVGVAAVALHLSLGLARFVESWGLARARVAGLLATLISVLLFALGVLSVVSFATGSAVPRFLY